MVLLNYCTLLFCVCRCVCVCVGAVHVGVTSRLAPGCLGDAWRVGGVYMACVCVWCTCVWVGVTSSSTRLSWRREKGIFQTPAVSMVTGWVDIPRRKERGDRSSPCVRHTHTATRTQIHTLLTRALILFFSSDSLHTYQNIFQTAHTYKHTHTLTHTHTPTGSSRLRQNVL